MEVPFSGYFAHHIYSLEYCENISGGLGI